MNPNNARQTPSLWVRLMLNPLSYLHPQRLQCRRDWLQHPDQHAVINAILLKHYALSVELEYKPTGPAALWLQYWPWIVQTIFLLACQKLRAEFLYAGWLLKLPDWAQSFIQLPLRTHHIGTGKKLSWNKIFAYGLAELLSWEVPLCLQQRLKLLFSPQTESLLTEESGLRHDPDIDLFLFAAQYAKTHFDSSFTRFA